MTDPSHQPRCSTDPEPTTVDALFGLALFIVIFCCFVFLWCGFPQSIIAEAAQYFDWRAWVH